MNRLSFVKIFAYIFSVLILLSVATQPSSAATLTTISDTISTSRPSAASPLSADATAGSVQLSVFNNGSRYLASDSARIIRTTTGNTVGNAVSTASQSADLATVYLPTGGGTSANASNGIDVLTVPITAVHTVKFTATTTIPNGGHIVITFPGNALNIASPSATTFSFNNLSSGNISANNATCSSYNIGAPSITCNLGAQVNAGTVVTILIGCSAQSSGSCTTQVPTLINPTKTATAGTGDQWKVVLQTLDASSNVLDTGKTAISTIDSVTVKATVDVYLTFSISGLSNGVAVNTGNTTGCTISSGEVTNSGLASTSTAVDLGTLANTPSAIDTQIGNEAAQLLAVTTNGAGGYIITATSSGQLIDPSSGFFINSSTTPAAFPNGLHYFGIHPCGSDVSAATWTSSGANQTCRSYITGSTGNICQYAWPTQTTAVSLASDSSGPVGNTVTAGNGLVTVLYAAGADANVPAGSYNTAITYVATATF